MDASKEEFERDDKFLKVFSVVAGVIAVCVALYILMNVIAKLMTIS